MKFEWLRKHGEKLFLGTFAGIALVLSVLTLTVEPLLPAQFLAKIPAVMLILLASFVLVFLFGYERRVIEMSTIMTDCRDIVQQTRAGMSEHVRRWEGLGITEIYRSRSDPGQKEEYVNLLQKAGCDLFVVGVTLKDLTREDRPTLIEKATNGCSVRLLMLTPARWMNEHPVLDPVESGDLKDHFVSSLRNIRRIAESVAKRNTSGKGRGAKRRGGQRTPAKHTHSFEVRFYDQSPALSMAIADGDTDSGRLRVEFTPHNESERGLKYFRPMMDVVPRDDGLFQQFYQHYSGLWERSKPYLCVSGSKIYRNQQLDIEVSEMLGLSSSWVPEESLGEDLTNAKAPTLSR